MKLPFAWLPDADREACTAAQGWLELGNAREARAEWLRTSAPANEDPVVLDLGWSIHALLKEWDASFEIADKMVQLHPGRAVGWIHRAYSARRKTDGGVSVALAALWPAADRFPREPIIPYNLACYAAQLGQVGDAWRWYQQAETRGNAHSIRKMALADSDLQPIWERLDSRD